MGYVPEATVFHSGNHSTGGVGSKIYEYYWTRNALRLVEEVTRGSKVDVLRRILPFLTRRLRDLAHQRRYAFICTAIVFDALGVFDFLRGKTGHRAGLPAIRSHGTTIV
jgi:GT2 family glycosyltransferase